MLYRFNMAQLKLIAMVTMAIDHAAVAMIYRVGLDHTSVLFEKLGLAMRLVGRMAFPLYCFMLVQGFIYTRDWKKYTLRVGLFAVVSELPFNLVVSSKLWYPDKQNTIVLMFLALLCMKGMEMGNQLADRIDEEERTLADTVLRWVLCGLTALVGILLAELVHADYGAFGMVLILLLYLFRNRPAERTFSGCTALFVKYKNWYAIAAWIAFFFIDRYNGERGRKLGLLPYVFYPAHLLLFYAVGRWIAGLLI